jgi:predicted transcriptional regulator
MSRLQNNFTQVPNNIILENMSFSALKVMLYLLTYQHKDDIFPSIGRMSTSCGLHESSIKRGLKSLVEKNFITINKNSGKDHRSHSYIINFEQIDGDCVLSPEECELRKINIQRKQHVKREKELKDQILKTKSEEQENRTTV